MQINIWGDITSGKDGELIRIGCIIVSPFCAAVVSAACVIYCAFLQ